MLTRSSGIQQKQFIQVIANHFEVVQSAVIVENAVSLTVNGELWLTFMCTPVDLEAMAVGFLFNEGFIQSPKDIADIHLCPGEEKHRCLAEQEHPKTQTMEAYLRLHGWNDQRRRPDRT